MKVGLIVRGENRGLGLQSWEAYRHLQPERTLLVDMGELARGFAVHDDRYPGAQRVCFDGHRFSDVDLVQDWLRGLDVVWTAETFYDWRIVDWAAAAGVATVCVINPEFWHDGRTRPTATWAATRWRWETLPADTRHVPHPVCADRFPLCRVGPRAGKLRLLHIVGHRAAQDRNGTITLHQAVRRMRGEAEVIIRTQDVRLPAMRSTRTVTVKTELGGRSDYWSLYEDADLLVLPRKYGGLCLPVQEAMAAGLGVIMTDVEPQRSLWPVELVPARHRGNVRSPAGTIECWDADARALGRSLDALTANREQVYALQRAATTWAREHTWEKLLPLWKEELERAANAC